MNSKTEPYRRYLETLTLETLDRLSEFVVDDVRFTDPLHDVQGVGAMSNIFRNMFASISKIKFQIQHVATDGDTCMMSFRFTGQLSGKVIDFKGVSIISFNAEGYVTSHVEYWDPCRSLYEKFPVIGPLFAAVRRQVASRSGGQSLPLNQR